MDTQKLPPPPPLSIHAIQNDEALRHMEFPVTKEKVFLGHARVSPLPRRVASAISDHANRCMLGDQEEVSGKAFIHETRRVVARLIHAKPEEIAFVGPTSNGLSFVAGGLKWRRGDNVLVYQDDYPSNVYPWMALEDQGVQVRFLNLREPGRIRLIDVQGQVDENTRLVALASCHFVSGWRIDVDAIGQMLRARGILFCLDAIQTLGAFPLSMEHVDFMAADSHKWLLGPCGVGVFYVKSDLQDRLRPIVHGWHNIACPDFLAAEDLDYMDDSRRYEAGSAVLTGLAGLKAACELAWEIGVDSIASRLLEYREQLFQYFKVGGWWVFHVDAPTEAQSGIVSISNPQADVPAIHRRLTEQGFVTSLRMLRGGRRILRISPHYYNTPVELDRLCEAIGSVA